MVPPQPRSNPLSVAEIRFSRDQMIPAQQPTPLKLTKSADYYEQRCVKYPHRACFHSYAEFLHALLLEADCSVTAFVPQPYRLFLNRSIYVPDVYLVRDRRLLVLELKPRGEFDPEKARPLQEFFRQYGIEFGVLANETVLEQETLALNWLPLVQILAQANDHGIDTQEAERRILGRVMEAGVLSAGEVLGEIQTGDTYHDELALYRLLHRHELSCDLSQSPLDYDSEIVAWS